MPNYRYVARDSSGAEVAGRIEAADEASARAELLGQGFRLIELAMLDDVTALAAAVLTPSQVEQVTEPIAQLSAGGLPLVAGLRAAARESSQPKVAAALERIARELEDGRQLEEVMASDLFPPHVGRLVAAAARSGNLGQALGEIVDHQSVLREVRATLVQGFAYPTLVTGLAAAVLLASMYVLVPTFSAMYSEFELSLPIVTQLVFWWHDTGLLVLAGCFAVAWLAAYVARRFLGPATWARMMAGIPLVGKLSLWSAMAEWSSLVCVLLRHQIPLPDALRLSGQGIANAHLSRMAESYSNDVANGHSLSDAVSRDPKFPATARALIRWGEENGMLSESFAMSRRMFLRRLRGRTRLLRTIGIPLLFIGIVWGFKFVVGGLVVPLVSLIQGLA